MSKIFENGSDSELEIKTDNEYAKNYDKWRKKEELNKLKTKYGEEFLESETSSTSDDDDDDDDEEGSELTEEIEKRFFKTLSYLKNKDPQIYDENIKFFNENGGNEKSAKEKKKKEKPMYIGDYERELILKKNNEFSDTDENEGDPRSRSPTYIEEQKKLKESFKKALNEVAEDDDDDNEEWGGMLRARQKTEKEKAEEEADYREWLAGRKEQIEDKEFESELKPLKEFWNDKNLDEGEKFLRDYILQKKYLDEENEDYIPTYEEVIHDSDKDLSEDENAIEKQEQFEHKYNFRFEESDQEFIKRYPRTLEHSLRKTDDRRKLKRAETKQRKQREKEEKRHELRKLQELKRKEIEEKIERLKEITGNTDIQFDDDDFEGDFDPEAHDKKMRSLFSDEFYAGAEGEQKPEFPELDEYLEIENWEKWRGEGNAEESEEHEPHCEDEDFNMDCDYDPQSDLKKELIDNSKCRKRRKRKSLFAKAVAQPKPVFDPNDTTYEEYLDEYYKLDCEDIIGDIPCRFKYRKVVPNSFGLTIDEILTANDRELNKWCSLKKVIQMRPDNVEKYDQIAYAKKGSNIDLKRKILPSLFQNERCDAEEAEGVGSGEKKKKKSKKVRCKKSVCRRGEEGGTGALESHESKGSTDDKNVKIEISEAMSSTNSSKKTNSKRRKSKKKAPNASDAANASNVENGNKKVTRKRKLSLNGAKSDVPNEKKKKTSKNSKKQDVGISDARLSAYGINPKKFKNRLKYKK